MKRRFNTSTSRSLIAACRTCFASPQITRRSTQRNTAHAPAAHPNTSYLIDKLDNIMMLASFEQLSSTVAAGRTSTSVHTGTDSTRTASAPQQRGGAAFAHRVLRNCSDVFRSVTFADASAVIVPMFFVGFKVGILLSVMLRGQIRSRNTLFSVWPRSMLLLKAIVLFQRRVRMRRRTAPQAAAPPAPQAADGNAGGEQAPPTATANTAAGAPAGANVPPHHHTKKRLNAKRRKNLCAPSRHRKHPHVSAPHNTHFARLVDRPYGIYRSLGRGC